MPYTLTLSCDHHLSDPPSHTTAWPHRALQLSVLSRLFPQSLLASCTSYKVWSSQLTLLMLHLLVSHAPVPSPVQSTPGRKAAGSAGNPSVFPNERRTAMLPRAVTGGHWPLLARALILRQPCHPKGGPGTSSNSVVGPTHPSPTKSESFF